MTDVVDKETRSRMMSGIRGKDTKPEIIIRSQLHRLGFRFRIHMASLPGKPDLVFRKHHAVVFVHGCFWHRHNCHLFKWPKTRPDFWKKKIEGNYQKDILVKQKLISDGWRVCIVWECSLKGRKKDTASAIRRIANWLDSGSKELEISG